MAALRIFSYLPNPRIWKATIAGRLCNVDVEIRGTKPGDLAGWLWDFDARPLTEADKAAMGTPTTGKTGFSSQLYKTDAFLKAHPFGTVPAAFSPDGLIGIFESNSIARTVARLGEDTCPLYGKDAYEASRIDGFLDVSLIFARDTQRYLLSMLGQNPDTDLRALAEAATETYLSGMERALDGGSRFVAGDALSLADVVLAAEISEFRMEGFYAEMLAKAGIEQVIGNATLARFPAVKAHYERLAAHPAFAPDMAPFIEKLSKNETIFADRL
jgi:glutathione S-transferase